MAPPSYAPQIATGHRRRREGWVGLHSGATRMNHRERVTVTEIHVGSQNVKVPHTVSGGFVCPVCGHMDMLLKQLAWSPGDTRVHGELPEGVPSFETCACCNTQFGLDDLGAEQNLLAAWNELRNQWRQRVSADVFKRQSEVLIAAGVVV
jgi:hypothetical protein